MAIVNQKSSLIQNSDAGKPYLTVGSKTHLPIVKLFEKISVAATDNSTSTYRVMRLDSATRLFSLKIANPVLTGGTSYSIGAAYMRNSDGTLGSVIGAGNQIASAINMTTARTSLTEVFAPTAANYGKHLWEILGLTDDPRQMLDIIITANTAGTVAGDIAVLAEFTSGTED